MTATKTDTAHETWNARWGEASGRADWLEPDPRVARAIETARGRGAARALDLGAGVGRHALAMARAGLETHATDMAANGLAEIARAAEAEGLHVATQTAPMTLLPYPDGHFDYVLAFNVIYHGDGPVVEMAIAEIARVLKPGGLYQGTMLSKRNFNYGQGREIAPGTFVREGEDDKIHPHFYCDAAGLVGLFAGFELLDLHDHEQKPGHWHWHMLAERRGA